MITSIDTTKIKKLRHVNSENSAENLIKHGWILLNASAVNSEEPAEYKVIYILGWDKDEDPPNPLPKISRE